MSNPKVSENKRQKPYRVSQSRITYHDLFLEGEKMTVQELIDRLRTFPPKLLITVEVDDGVNPKRTVPLQEYGIYIDGLDGDVVITPNELITSRENYSGREKGLSGVLY